METLGYITADRKESPSVGALYQLTIQLSGGGISVQFQRGCSSDRVIGTLRAIADRLERDVILRSVGAESDAELASWMGDDARVTAESVQDHLDKIQGTVVNVVRGA